LYGDGQYAVASHNRAGSDPRRKLIADKDRQPTPWLSLYAVQG
jgi:hypothetical protein